jgi:hypothetical protein
MEDEHRLEAQIRHDLDHLLEQLRHFRCFHLQLALGSVEVRQHWRKHYHHGHGHGPVQ